MGNAPPDEKIVRKVMEVQNRHTLPLLQQEGIVGTGTGLDKDGKVVINVYTSGAGNPVIPKTLEGVPVQVIMRGPIRLLDGFAGQPQYNPKLRLSRPSPIGVSAFNEESPACNGSVCATGTLGCRLRPRDGSGGVYALSNNHVFANENSAPLNTDIVQPGPLDINCQCVSTNVVGQLFRFKPVDVTGLQPNVIDAAIISTTTGMVSNATLPDGYGVPRTYTIKNPALGMKVMKYGRTTGFTKGVIVGVNVFVVVPYGGGIALFVKQIAIIGTGGLFGGPGDSGSLIVDENRFPVGLLFAGGGGITDANPIQDVLDFFEMEIDGDDSQDFVVPGKIGKSQPNSPIAP